MYKVPRHIWKTTDGTLVPEGHPEAAFLAYPAGDEFSDDDAQARGLLTVYPEKARRKPADKAVPKQADKSGAPTEVKE